MALSYLLHRSDCSPSYSTLLAESSLDVASAAFHYKRLDRLRELGRLPGGGQGFALIHVLPTESIERRGLPNQGAAQGFLWHGVEEERTDVDGLVLPSTTTDWETVTTLSRDGWTEVITQSVHRAINQDESRIVMYDLEGALFSAFEIARRRLDDAPLCVIASLSQIEGERVHLHDNRFNDGPQIDQGHFMVQTVEESDERADQVLRCLVDQLWQGCGVSRSHNYTEEGTWSPWDRNFPG